MPRHEENQIFDAICPKCEKRYKLRINWIGNGTPRIYCDECRKSISRISEIIIYDTNRPTKKGYAQ